MYAKSTRPSTKREVQKERSAQRDVQIAHPRRAQTCERSEMHTKRAMRMCPQSGQIFSYMTRCQILNLKKKQPSCRLRIQIMRSKRHKKRIPKNQMSNSGLSWLCRSNPSSWRKCHCFLSKRTIQLLNSRSQHVDQMLFRLFANNTAE